MKKILLTLGLMALPGIANAGMSAVVHNTSGATTGEDSITVSFIVTDSIGNISGLDSIFVAIWNSVSDSVYAAGYITTAAEIDSIDLGGNRTVWRWTEQVSDIDAGGRIGTYTGIIIGIDTLDGTGAEYLDQSAFFSFQLINGEYAQKLDSSNQLAFATDISGLNVAGGIVESNLEEMGGVTQSGIDLKDFADQGYDPAINTVLSDLTFIKGLVAPLNNFEDDYDGTGFNKSASTIANVTTVNGLAANTITASALAASAITELLDSLFTTRVDADTATNSYFGSLLNDLTKIRDSLQFLITATSSSIGDVTLADGEFAIVADSVWNADTLNHNAVVGSFGEFLYKPQSASLTDADMAAIADSVWQADTTTHDGVAGSYGATNTSPLRPTVNGRQLDVTTTGEAGIDFSNIAGTLDSGEVSDSFLPGAKLATSYYNEFATKQELAAEAGDSVWGHTDSAFTANTFGSKLRDSVKSAAFIADATWDEDSTGHYTSPQMAFVASQTGASAGISDADMAAIADTVWGADTATHNATVGSFGEFLYKPQSASLTDADMAAIADSVWGVDTTNAQTVIAGIGRYVMDSSSQVSSGDTAIGGDERDVAIAAMRDSLQFLITSSGDTAIGGDERDVVIGLIQDTTNAILDTFQALAMDNLKEAFDDDATGPTMRLRAFNVIAATAGSTAVNFTGLTTGEAMTLTAGTGGNGLEIIGGSSLGDGVNISTTAGDGIDVSGGGGGAGLNILGGAANVGMIVQGGTNQAGMTITGSGTGHGLVATSGAGATGNGMQVTAASTNGDAIGLTATGTGIDLNAPDLVDLVWDEDTTGHKTDPQMGFFITQGGAASISDADMGAIADSVWDKDTTDGFAVLAGVGKFVKDSTQGAAGSLDSGVVSRVMHRVGWGTPQGSGSDSSTLAERDVTGTSDILSYMDTLIYAGAIWINATAGNTNTVIGTDGTSKNPVSTFAAARTLADALGTRRYNIIGNGTLTLAATHEEWVFNGVNRGATIALGGQDVDLSVFRGVIVTGAQGGTGEAWFIECELGLMSTVEGHFIECALMDTIGVRNNANIFFDNCHSTAAGLTTPTIDFGVATTNVSLRHYSGGIRFMDASSNDTINVEGVGQVILSANSANVNLVLRGHMSFPPDNDSSTGTLNLNKDANFMRNDAELWVWANADTSGSVDTSDVGVWLVNNVKASIAGTGSVTVVIGATDTSGTDTLVSGVPITLRDLAGNQIGFNQTTNTDGYTTWSLTEGDSMTVQIPGTVHNSHIWQSDADTFVVPASLDTFGVGTPTSADSLLMGYDVPVSTPSAANTCVITLHLGDIDGIVDNEDLFGRKVTFTLPGKHIDTCADPVTVMTNVSKTGTSDINGIVTVQLRYSNCLSDTQYDLTIDHPNFTNKTYTITVPRQATYTLAASDLQ